MTDLQRHTAASMSVVAAEVVSANKVKASLMVVRRVGRNLVVRQLTRRLDEVEQSFRELRDRDLRRIPSPVDRVRRRKRDRADEKRHRASVRSKADEIDQTEDVHHKNGQCYLAPVALTDEESQDLVTEPATRSGVENQRKLVKTWNLVVAGRNRALVKSNHLLDRTRAIL